ncbi:MAG: Asp23/Gls24 family envelope stress response protein [Chloroflexi bacterium]|nr:Asp23/Gls24 family envelope stress response protein [Chloroflexota bacterium]
MNSVNNTFGSIYISHRSISSIACQSALASYGVVGLATKNLTESLSRLLIKDPNHGVEVTYDGMELNISIFIIIEYGTRIKSVASSVSQNVKYQIENTTGLTVNQVNVHVRGLRISNTD